MRIMKNVRKCSLRYILFIQYQGYVMNINRGKAFMVCGMDGCFIVLKARLQSHIYGLRYKLSQFG